MRLETGLPRGAGTEQAPTHRWRRETGRPDPTTAGMTRLSPGPGAALGLGPQPAGGPPTSPWPRVCTFPRHVPLQSCARTDTSSSASRDVGGPQTFTPRWALAGATQWEEGVPGTRPPVDGLGSTPSLPSPMWPCAPRPLPPPRPLLASSSLALPRGGTALSPGHQSSSPRPSSVTAGISSQAGGGSRTGPWGLPSSAESHAHSRCASGLQGEGLDAWRPPHPELPDTDSQLPSPHPSRKHGPRETERFHVNVTRPPWI